MRDTTNRDDTRQRLILAGAGIMHRQGYNGTGIQQVLDACNVPKGSFYHYFRSKEDFALAVVEHHAALLADRIGQIFADRSLPPLERVRLFFNRGLERLSDPASLFSSCGCPLGNLVQEMAPANAAFRESLDKALGQMEQALAATLREAQAAGEMAARLDPDEAARFVLASWQGALLRMKAGGGPQSVARARDFLLDMLAP